MTSTADAVQQQYEAYPYPTRRPEEEAKRLLAPITDCLDMLNHHGFGGHRSFDREFRALVAGGGTGDSIIFLAEQLRGTQAELHYLDISKASMAVAQARAKARQLTNIHWHHGSLLELNCKHWGRFDYINCSGVLHHLPDPDLGLKTLKSLLAKKGVLALMVYGQHARTGVYQLQTLLRLINHHRSELSDQVDQCRQLLNNLPDSNWFQRGRSLFNDINMGDAGIVDLLLHSQDRAYTVPELYTWIQSAGLQLTTLFDPQRYWPSYYLSDPQLLDEVNTLDQIGQQAAAELIGGELKTHTLYAMADAIASPDPMDDELVPSLPINTPFSTYAGFQRLIAKGVTSGGATFQHQGESIPLPATPELATLLLFMDGDRSLGELYRATIKQGGFKRRAVQRAFLDFYQPMCERHLLFLRHRSISRPSRVEELQARLRT